MLNRIFKKILLIINCLLVGLLLISYLSVKVSPNVLPVFVFLNLLFPIVVGFNVVFVAVWIFLKKYYFIYSLLGLLIGFNLIASTFALSKPNKKATIETEAIKVLSYNVRVFDLYDWTHNKKTRNDIFSFIRAQDPGIACFQEYFHNTMKYYPVHDSLIENQRFITSHNFYNVTQQNGNSFGIATYSIYPIVNKKVIEFEDSYNLALITDLKIDNDTIRIFNCHFESVKFLKEDYQFMDSLNSASEERRKQGVKGVSTRLVLAAKKRAKQAEIIRSEISKSHYPVIVCGDFNDVPSSYTYNLVATDLFDSHKERGVGIGETYYRFFPFNRIDYILYSEFFKCINYQRHRVNYSDHYPITSTLEVMKSNL